MHVHFTLLLHSFIAEYTSTAFAPVLLDQKAQRLNAAASGDEEKGLKAPTYRSVMSSADRQYVFYPSSTTLTNTNNASSQLEKDIP